MKIFLFSLFCSGLFGFSAAQQYDYPKLNIPFEDKHVPAGWSISGSNPQDYVVGYDVTENATGQASAYLRSSATKPVGFINLMQEIKANNYRGMRIRLSAQIKVKFVTGWGGMWMRIEDIVERPLSFDDMSNRPIIGTSDWVQYDIVLDVPNNSDEISFGLTLNGKGQIWIDNIKLNVVNTTVPTTDMILKKTGNYYPENLDFEE